MKNKVEILTEKINAIRIKNDDYSNGLTDTERNNLVEEEIRLSSERDEIWDNDLESGSQMMDDEQDECHQGYMEYKRGY